MNYFGNNATSLNQFGDSAFQNYFGYLASSNSFGEGNSYNAFGYEALQNQFGYNSDSNSFGSESDNNAFGSKGLKILFRVIFCPSLFLFNKTDATSISGRRLIFIESPGFQ